MSIIASNASQGNHSPQNRSTHGAHRYVPHSPSCTRCRTVVGRMTDLIHLTHSGHEWICTGCMEADLGVATPQDAEDFLTVGARRCVAPNVTLES